jgi:hypothetical protein
MTDARQHLPEVAEYFWGKPNRRESKGIDLASAPMDRSQSISEIWSGTTMRLTRAAPSSISSNAKPVCVDGKPTGGSINMAGQWIGRPCPGAPQLQRGARRRAIPILR